MRLTAAVAGSLLFALPAAAGAADAPNLVGNWTRTAFSAAQIGEHAGYAPVTKPSLMHGDAQDWTMKIDAQDGGSFSGTLTGPSGRPQAILGTFQRDARPTSGPSDPADAKRKTPLSLGTGRRGLAWGRVG
jgi:hypothetical protein